MWHCFHGPKLHQPQVTAAGQRELSALSASPAKGRQQAASSLASSQSLSWAAGPSPADQENGPAITWKTSLGGQTWLPLGAPTTPCLWVPVGKAPLPAAAPSPCACSLQDDPRPTLTAEDSHLTTGNHACSRPQLREKATPRPRTPRPTWLPGSVGLQLPACLGAARGGARRTRVPEPSRSRGGGALPAWAQRCHRSCARSTSQALVPAAVLRRVSASARPGRGSTLAAHAQGPGAVPVGCSPVAPPRSFPCAAAGPRPGPGATRAL
nr:uncharacterized protein LOC125182668 [Anser cygnoides]